MTELDADYNTRSVVMRCECHGVAKKASNDFNLKARMGQDFSRV